MPGIPPIGYKNNREDKTMIIDNQRFGLVQQMWDYMLLGQYTVHEIARLADNEWHLTSIPRKKRGGKPILKAACITCSEIHSIWDMSSMQARFIRVNILPW